MRAVEDAGGRAVTPGLVHTAHGYWLSEAGGVSPAPALSGDVNADVVVIGGGYTGLWTAWQLRARGASVVLLEAELCGHGPSGRNGGFCETLWTHLPSLIERFGRDRAIEVCQASSESVEMIGAWCAEQGVDAWFRRGGFMMASTAPAHDAVIDEILAVAPGSRVRELNQAGVRRRCDSPRFRRGLFVRDDATVQPARLSLGLRDRVRLAGVEVFERSRVRALHTHPAGVTAETSGGRVRAGAAVLAVNAATRGLGPVRSPASGAPPPLRLTAPGARAARRAR